MSCSDSHARVGRHALKLVDTRQSAHVQLQFVLVAVQPGHGRHRAGRRRCPRSGSSRTALARRVLRWSNRSCPPCRRAARTRAARPASATARPALVPPLARAVRPPVPPSGIRRCASLASASGGHAGQRREVGGVLLDVARRSVAITGEHGRAPVGCVRRSPRRLCRRASASRSPSRSSPARWR